jgi:multidrug resistance efflux pump
LCLGLILAFFGGGVALLLWTTGTLLPRAPYSGPTFTVRKERLKIAIVARGSLESAKNGDVVCTVRAGQKGSTNSTVIKWLVDAGTEVSKGDKIMELDSSGFVEQLKDQNIKVDQARATMEKADADCETQKLDNDTDIQKAENAYKLAEIDLEKYLEGDYPQALNDVEGRITTAQSDLADWNERSAWSARMLKKGLGSKVQAEADKSRAEAAEINLNKLKVEKKVLVGYTYGRTKQDLESKLAEAERGVKKANGQAKAKLAAADAARLAQKSVYEQELSRKREIEAEIAKCLVYAPQDGLVVYYVPEQVKGGGGGAQQSVVAQGEPVREGQKMIQIPDLTQMVVNVKVPEAFVSHLRNESEGKPQPAEIQIDAFSSVVLKGHVKTVDTIASQADWFASDVKNYKTIVTIDNIPDNVNLRPGLSAAVKISADESSEPVLVVPVNAIVGSINMGAQRKCFVIGNDGQPVLRDIVVGMSNERFAEVKPWDDEKQTGLKEGEKVVENPRPLLSDDSDMKPGKVRAKADDADSAPGDNGGAKGKGKGKKKADGNGGAGNKGVSGAPNGAPSAEAQQKFQQFWTELQSATPERRRDMINGLPAEYRDRVRQGAVDKGLKIAD